MLHQAACPASGALPGPSFRSSQTDERTEANESGIVQRIARRRKPTWNSQRSDRGRRRRRMRGYGPGGPVLVAPVPGRRLHRRRCLQLLPAAKGRLRRGPGGPRAAPVEQPSGARLPHRRRKPDRPLLSVQRDPVRLFADQCGLQRQSPAPLPAGVRLHVDVRAVAGAQPLGGRTERAGLHVWLVSAAVVLGVGHHRRSLDAGRLLVRREIPRYPPRAVRVWSVRRPHAAVAGRTFQYRLFDASDARSICCAAFIFCQPRLADRDPLTIQVGRRDVAGGHRMCVWIVGVAACPNLGAEAIEPARVARTGAQSRARLDSRRVLVANGPSLVLVFAGHQPRRGAPQIGTGAGSADQPGRGPTLFRTHPLDAGTGRGRRHVLDPRPDQPGLAGPVSRGLVLHDRMVFGSHAAHSRFRFLSRPGPLRRHHDVGRRRSWLPNRSTGCARRVPSCWGWRCSSPSEPQCGRP